MLLPFFQAPSWTALHPPPSHLVHTSAFISRHLIWAEPRQDIRFSNSGFCALYLSRYVTKESKFCFGADSHLFSLQPALLLKQLELMLITCDPLIRGMGTVCSYNLQVVLHLTLSQAMVRPHPASFCDVFVTLSFLVCYVHTTLG
jgi:hypothetical protein